MNKLIIILSISFLMMGVSKVSAQVSYSSTNGTISVGLPAGYTAQGVEGEEIYASSSFTELILIDEFSFDAHSQIKQKVLSVLESNFEGGVAFLDEKSIGKNRISFDFEGTMEGVVVKCTGWAMPQENCELGVLTIGASLVGTLDNSFRQDVLGMISSIQWKEKMNSELSGAPSYSAEPVTNQEQRKVNTDTEKINFENFGTSFSLPENCSNILAGNITNGIVGFYVGESRNEMRVILNTIADVPSIEDRYEQYNYSYRDNYWDHYAKSDFVKYIRTGEFAAEEYFMSCQKGGRVMPVYLITFYSPSGLLLADVSILGHSGVINESEMQIARQVAATIQFSSPKPISPQRKAEMMTSLQNQRYYYFSRYSSGGDGYSHKSSYTLCGSGRFYYNIDDQTAWAAGGSATVQDDRYGNWDVESAFGNDYLILHYQSGNSVRKIIEYIDGDIHFGGGKYLPQEVQCD